ncbi:phosphocholine-specific phospholipase C [Catenuloplanes sp. NPDC051500]|uniref:phosphocholine-specific phospholipase C n=1 Tax=Catenuloplanes sp. NPDC051500 TaxID=3363959 RepID=UPI00378C3818
MSTVDRRSFLTMLGAPAIGAALPAGLERAVRIAPDSRHGSIRDVEHVIFLMQENRSFDHYYGAMRGVRGFSDPHPARMRNGEPVWRQPHEGGVLLPFRPDVPDVGQMFLPDPPHGWNDGHAAFNDGRFDAWVPQKGVTTMTHHVRGDLPYQFALADAFTVLDNYHCSLLGPTDPNRYHMWSGWVGNDGKGGGPVVTNAELGYDWTTYPERLTEAGVSWRVYQDVGNGLDAAGSWGWTQDPYIGNYGDNSLLYFDRYRNAAPGEDLYQRSRTGTSIVDEGRDPLKLLTDFEADVAAGRLPKVSWIVAPEAYTEHPNWEPGFGAWYVSQVIDILAAHPEVWSKMALFITYDEEGGFFDHLVPPTPPRTPAHGASTVPITNEIFPGDGALVPGPYGLGMRVPMVVVSPWTRGGWVNSQVSDHTSLIRFLEQRFGVREPNITPWRRAVTSDLTGAFDFRTPNDSAHVRLPDTGSYRPADLTRHPDEVPVPPADPQLPAQERGVRPARALPYRLHADLRGSDLRLRSDGGAAAVFNLRAPDHDPRTFTVGDGSEITASLAGYGSAEVHGPNGFFRRFAFGGRTPVDVRARYDEHRLELILEISSRSAQRAEVRIADRYKSRARTLTLKPRETRAERWSLARTKGWYDLTVTATDTELRYAGHLENGKASISDPGMGGLI